MSLKLADVMIIRNGTVLFVLRRRGAKTEKFITTSLMTVIVLLALFGMELIAILSKDALGVKFLMLKINVSVRMAHILMETFVNLLAALEVNSGMEETVSVLVALIGMEPTVCNASMAKFGILQQKAVFVQPISHGTEISVKNIYTVLEEESITKITINVFALKVHIGMELNVSKELRAAVDKSSTKPPCNAIVLKASIMMETNVCPVCMERYSIRRQKYVNVKQEASGMDNFVLLFKNVLEV